MNRKTYCTLTGCIFLVVALLHVARIFSDWEAVIGGWTLPMWLSVVAVPVAGFLAYVGFACAKDGAQ
ncbi:MAG: hypothetical protein A3C93_03570 [Candidatus Lloydbacteria bacterium RIFCSPHIGHO2_02_FULL_54_17]|uniref:Uncharacterized protein n=1 Tax=Candidatus Lloydbacteria bacterium RIFCSPHIGHO2_02_FULL_54_17 TaxID=1798664 RepID=A0A1G2DEK4_9BACT|nr:MAG: hypothetical protein A2762_03710 [Candidatus Lloydbacteria bacterium RIFCSPHIGHO2_01_FULL_54_11]OGZ11218.1 MAG: hypothetical protein A3C93_03570 [Candidatus Lloydbacteria bacterium RIFCSPHIGHO2_02_FULL_54_17]OGZ13881.1 MAG: hypothetical protein A2948_02385 [Candidatus Lloydbacteria bacterium RIFCSPLOWO2_01_FULL_54_18]OGZ16555.1 MAG: hypothetical protein A3H76_01200 [Candidatus Lloydbacteria bacterium RIFCSPLOWO2_02_FULL_54_12]